MFRQLVKVGHGLAKQLNLSTSLKPSAKQTSNTLNKRLHFQPPQQQQSININHIQAAHYHQQLLIRQSSLSSLSSSISALSTPSLLWQLQQRHFHAAGSKVRYLDFRHRFKTHHLRLNLLIIRRQKMKKHKFRKWRKKFKCLLAKKRLKREIAKEKAFRVELLSMIRIAENFDPKEYALRKIAEINNKPKELSKEEKLERLKGLIREHRYQVDYIKPKHRRADV